LPAGEPTSAGLSPDAAADILVAPYNDLDTTAAIAEAHRHDLAAIIVEPLHRCTSPRLGFLAGLRRLATEHGALLVFDETVTGLRLAYGGAQAYYGVTPDLAAFGKALGGGYPLGAVAGRADVICSASRSTAASRATRTPTTPSGWPRTPPCGCWPRASGGRRASRSPRRSIGPRRTCS
jgi:glutamate-1-semialdehyde 2,1-aminomutase